MLAEYPQITPRSSSLRTRCCTAETDRPVCLASSVKLSRPSAASSARIFLLVASTGANLACRKRPADNHPLDLVGALDNLQHLGLAHEALDTEVLDVTVAAEHLHGIGGDLHRGVAGKQLRHRGLLPVRQAGVLAPGRGQVERPRR